MTSSGSTYGKAAYTYNELDQLTAINHYNASTAYQTRSFAYDGYGRVTSQATPEAGTVYYHYTSDDLVDYAENDRIVSGSTKYRATISYNGRHQITQVSYNDSDATPDVYYTYGEYGERTLMQEKNDAGTVLGSTTYSYDTYKRLQTETRVFNGLSGTYSVGYSYNNVDEVTQVSYTVNGWTKNVNYAYTYASALASVGTNLISGTTTTNVINSLAYRGFGAVKSLNYGSNPRKLAIGYDPKRQQISNVTVKKTDNTDTIINSDYDYYNGGNNNGRIQKITDNVDSAFTTTYGYDDYNRLTSASATNYTRSYSYDVWGNLREVTSTGNGETGSYTLLYEVNGSTAPATNQIANTAYSYDNAGSMTNDGVTAYTYDAANRLKTAGSNNSYKYDGDGRRVSQAAGGYSPVFYLWSSVLGQPVVEIDSGANVYRAYVYGGGSQPIAMQSYDYNFYWVHTDHLGSGRKLTNASGTVVYRGEFDPHGQAVYEWANGGATYLNSKKFTGYERDWATNLDNAQARMYAHNRGRFMQADPLGLGAADMTAPQSLNLYSYVENDLMNSIDPTGLVLYLPAETGGEGGEEEIDYDWYSIWHSMWRRPRGVSNSFGGGEGQQGGGSGGGPAQQKKKEPCPPIPQAPPGVSIDANIERAKRHRPVGPFSAYNDAMWFHDMVQGKGSTAEKVKAGNSWNYKKLGSQYADFGNFNYGATGAAIGFSEETLLLAKKHF